MENIINLTLKDKYGEGGLDEVIVYGKFYVSFVDQKNVVYSSNIVAELKGVSDSKGEVRLEADTLVNNKEYQKYHELWWNTIYSDGLREPETDFFIRGKIYNSSTQRYATKVWEVSFVYGNGEVSFNEKGDIGNVTLDYDFTLNSITNDLDITKLKQKFKDAETNYLYAKEEYTSNIKNVSIDTTSVFERVADYEPTSWVYVITRLLELNEGTIEPALRFTKNAEMSVENKRLTMIQKTIENLLNLYPDITIDDGEGIPYNK